MELGLAPSYLVSCRVLLACLNWGTGAHLVLDPADIHVQLAVWPWGWEWVASVPRPVLLRWSRVGLALA